MHYFNISRWKYLTMFRGEETQAVEVVVMIQRLPTVIFYLAKVVLLVRAVALVPLLRCLTYALTSASKRTGHSVSVVWRIIFLPFPVE